jgi:5-formyltetrahydrofolate cyclo-ligase
VLVFLPLADEVDLRPLLDAGFECAFAATRTPDHGGTLSVHEMGGPLEVHRLGFLQPHATAPEVDPAELDVLLLPGLAFDLWGTRLGRGGGYYDRLLMRVTLTAQIVGVTPAALVVDRLPSEPHDVPVAYLATEEGVIEVAT